MYPTLQHQFGRTFTHAMSHILPPVRSPSGADQELDDDERRCHGDNSADFGGRDHWLRVLCRLDWNVIDSAKVRCILSLPGSHPPYYGKDAFDARMKRERGDFDLENIRLI